MTKYLKLMTYAAVAVAFASPAYADIVNLYEMNNSEFYGSDGFGHGQDGYTYKCNKSNHEYDYVPAGMICDEKKYGSVTCHINCRCKNDYKYSEDNCNNGLVPGGSSCTNPGTTKKLYTACDCGPDAITESDYNYLSIYFTEGSFRPETVDDKTCMFISNPSCKEGYIKFTSKPEDNDKSVLNTRRFAADLTSAVQPIKYSFVASSANPKSDPKTVYCLIDTTIPEKFNGSVSFYESELNATCSNHSNRRALLDGKEFFYYDNVCQTGNHSDISCDVSGIPTEEQETSSFSYYDNVTNSVKSITCSYISTSNYCTTNGYKKSCADDEIEYGKPCKYDPTYINCIKKEDWCKNNDYKVTACNDDTYDLSGQCRYHPSYYQKCILNKDKNCESKGFKKCTTNEVASGATCQGNTVTYYATCTLKTTWCNNNGYYNPCPNGQVVDEESPVCQYNTSYKTCIEKYKWCEKNGFKNSCSEGQELSGDVCRHDTSYREKCVTLSATQLCQNQGYTIPCGTGYFNNGPYCTGDSGVKYYTTACTKITCSQGFPSIGASITCADYCTKEHYMVGPIQPVIYANDGVTKCYTCWGAKAAPAGSYRCPSMSGESNQGGGDSNALD